MVDKEDDKLEVSVCHFAKSGGCKQPQTIVRVLVTKSDWGHQDMESLEE